MTEILILLIFFGGAIICLYQVIKFNKLVLKEGWGFFSKKTNIKVTIKAILIAFAGLIITFLLIAAILYLKNPKNFHIYY